MMKIFKTGLRIWLTITSVLSFLAGWILLVHSPKPAPITGQVADVPTLQPLPPLDAFTMGDENFQNQTLFNVQPRPRFGTNSFFRTGGS